MKPRTFFESTEHQILGEVLFHGLNSLNILMPNNVRVHMGDVIALVDYYAIPKKPISLGDPIEERKARFLEAYNSLACSSEREINKLLKMFAKQRQKIFEAMEKNLPESAGVRSFALEEFVKGLYYTCGKSLSIMSSNYDHFADNAMDAHRAGHLVAQEVAVLAHNAQDPITKYSLLCQAYALAGFSFHFITDRCASGHMRTPRYELQKLFGESGAILALFMHGEENATGLNVKNDSETWQTFGDAHLLEQYNERTKTNTVAILQILIDDVYKAYQTGVVNTKDSAAYEKLPKATGINIQPMFVYDPCHGTILYRCNVDKLDCTDYKVLTWAQIPSLLCHFVAHYFQNNMNNGKNNPHLDPMHEVKINVIGSHTSYSIFAPSKKKVERLMEEKRAQSSRVNSL